MTPSAARIERIAFAKAAIGFALSVCTIVAASIISARLYPEKFDWVYTVMSALASRKHNPEGAVIFAVGLGCSIGLLWPSVSWIARGVRLDERLRRIGVRALRLGILFGVLIGLERLMFFHISNNIRKAHEALALLCFLNLYAGVLMIHIDRIRRRSGSIWPALLVVAPLLAIGISHIALYLDQRDLGWVDTSWREMGIPFWKSFAFWQWLAAFMLWTGIGHLTFTAKGSCIES